MFKTLGLTAAAALMMVTTSANIEACTGLKLKAADGKSVNGRTLEFGIMVDTSIAIIPRGYEFVGTTPNGKGLPYKSKYAVVGAIAFDNVAIMDGMNEKGLAVGAFYFPTFADYTPITSENQSKALSPVEFPNWIVTQFATIDEVKAALSSVVIAPTVTPGWGPTPAPFHYIVYDKSGNSLVIEPINGKLVTYDNPLGVFTNSPTFDWHMTNLRNYIGLNPENAKELKLPGLTLKPLGQGIGMMGLPGNFSPPSRFVRVAVFTATAIPSATAEEAVFQGFHILNQFDIPVGVAREKADGVIYSDYTLVTVIKDPQSLKYYFKTYDDQAVKFVDLNKFDLNAKAVKKISTAGEGRGQDISSSLR